MAKIEDLIAKCDESEIMTQDLQANTTNMQIRKGQGEITFVTDQQIIFDATKGERKKIGFVIWFPADVFDRL